jgi:PAS domain S-box-containing protein
VFEQSPSFLAVLRGPTNIFELVNPAYLQIIGAGREVLGKPLFEAIPETRGQGFDVYLERVRTTGEPLVFRDLPVMLERVPGAPLEERFIDITYLPLVEPDGSHPAVIAHGVDVTEQVRARLALAENERQFRTLADAIPTLAWTAKADGYIDWYNARWYEYTGTTPAQMEGWGWQSVHDPAVLPAVMEAWRASIATGEPFEMTFPLRRADGRFCRFLTRVTPVRDTAGTVVRWFGTNTDVEAERQALDTAESALESLEEANARLQEQQLELELINQQLQDNAIELELQSEELQATAAHLEERTEAAETARQTVTAIIDAITDGFVAFDRDLRYTFVNARAAQLWSTPAATMIGKSPGELWPGMHGSAFVALLRRVVETGKPETLEGYSATLRLPIELRAYPLQGGGVVAFFTDLTEHHRAEEAATFLADASRVLASASDYATTLSNLARAAVPRLGDWCAVDVIVDPDREEWPPRIERVAVVHQDPAKVELARTLTTRFPQDWSRDTGTPGVLRTRQPMFVPEVTDAMLAAGAQNETHAALLQALHIRSIMIVPLVARDRVLGTITLVMAESVRRFTDADLALAVDLGQRAGVALDNARLLRNAKEANAVKTEFLRNVSHELRQPLNAIRGYVDLWRSGSRGELPASLHGDLERLSRNQEHLTALIEDLLSFTRLEVGRLTVERVVVPIAAMFASLEAMVRPQMDLRGLHFDYERCDPSLAALGDEDRVLQVCLNLLTNAMRATPAGGRVSLGCTADGPSVVITVTDTGVGIPSDKLASIFEPFTQLGRALNAPKEGAGLGLAISRGLAEAMGGSLTVASELGSGSTFTFRLPRAESGQSSA